MLCVDGTSISAKKALISEILVETLLTTILDSRSRQTAKTTEWLPSRTAIRSPLEPNTCSSGCPTLGKVTVIVDTLEFDPLRSKLFLHPLVTLFKLSNIYKC